MGITDATYLSSLITVEIGHETDSVPAILFEFTTIEFEDLVDSNYKIFPKNASEVAASLKVYHEFDVEEF